MASFPPFNNLPLELRLQIWDLALPAPKVVEINLSISKPPFANCPPPALLAVCSESRTAALKRYHASFTPASAASKRCPAGVYIDPHRDTVLLLPPCRAPCYTAPSCFECVHFDYGARLAGFDAAAAGARAVRRVAIYSLGLQGLAGLWRFFPGVRALSVVVDEYWTDFDGRREALLRALVDLRARAEEDVPELAGRDVKVRVVRIAEVL